MFPAVAQVNESQATELLHAAARVRFQAKAAQFHARARHVGWEQALWEGLFRALGYKHNVWPMQNLAESWPRWSHDADSAFVLQARLLGISGLLPAELTRLRPAARDSGAAERARHRAWMVMFAASGIAGGASARNSATAYCRARSGNFTGCVRQIIRNAGSRWRRTGWRQGI